MNHADIKIRCSRCLGTGFDDNETIEIHPGNCVPCGGVGYIVKDRIDITDIMATLPNATKLIYSYQIVEVINPTEYAALGDAAKDGLRIHLSCGLLDLVHTGNIYLNLMAIFGSSPITKAAITAL